MPIGNNFTPNNNTDSTTDENKSGTYKQERDIDRKVQPSTVQNFVSSQERVKSWEQDPVTLKDYSQNLFVEAFIDQIAKDVSKSDWSVMKDEDQMSDVIKFLEQSHPTKSWTDLIEATVREMLRTGNAFWFKHRFEDSDEIAEIVIPDSTTIFQVVDENGYVIGYVQKRRGNDAEIVDKEDVVHFNWGSSADRYYSKSPVEMSMDVIEILDELTFKEILDLREGSQAGVVSVDEHNMGSQEWNRFVDELTRANEGERHKISVTEGSLDFVNLSSNYEELKILSRYEHHIQALSSAFKVSPSYVGFNFGGGGIGQGRARDSERENHREGVNTVIEQLQERINRDLIKEEFDEDAKFRFENRDESDEKRVEHIKNVAVAVNNLQEAGVPARIENGSLVLPEDYEISENPEAVEEGEQLDECVESILEENPDMSEDEAFAICNDQIDGDKEISDELLEDRDKSFFVPDDGAAEEAQQALDWEDEHDNDIDAFGSDGEGLRRAQQIVNHNENDEPLDIEYWEEIDNFHSRHHAQDNHLLDDEFEGEPWKDNGYISHLAWGGDPAFSQAEDIIEYVESVNSEEDLSDRQKELCEALETDSIKEALITLEEDKNRTEAISQAQEMLSGKMSQSTYYNWLEKYDLK